MAFENLIRQVISDRVEMLSGVTEVIQDSGGR
jgi:hypothetical protein